MYVMIYLVSKSNVRLSITTVTGVVYFAIDGVLRKEINLNLNDLIKHYYEVRLT